MLCAETFYLFKTKDGTKIQHNAWAVYRLYKEVEIKGDWRSYWSDAVVIPDYAKKKCNIRYVLGAKAAAGVHVLSF